MKITPPPGIAFIQEDKRDFGETLIDIPDEAKRGVGTQGIIIAITNLPQQSATLYFEALCKRCYWVDNFLDQGQRDELKSFCSAMELGRELIPAYAEGDHVLFSRFNEQIVVYENGVESIYYAVPVQSVLGILHFDA